MMLINMFFCENNKLHSNRTIDFTGISIDYNYPTSKKKHRELFVTQSMENREWSLVISPGSRWFSFHYLNASAFYCHYLKSTSAVHNYYTVKTSIFVWKETVSLMNNEYINVARNCLLGNVKVKRRV